MIKPQMKKNLWTNQPQDILLPDLLKVSVVGLNSCIMQNNPTHIIMMKVGKKFRMVLLKNGRK